MFEEMSLSASFQYPVTRRRGVKGEQLVGAHSLGNKRFEANGVKGWIDPLSLLSPVDLKCLSYLVQNGTDEGES